MKSKSKVLLSSIASIALCSSIAVGGTFALFTSESQVNIAVTSGKVSVMASVNAESLKTYSMDVLQDAGKFENGGTAILVDNQLNLNLMSPGDKATFTIDVENNSTITVQYKLTWTVEGDLADGLEILANGNELADVSWTELAVGTNIASLAVSVELPEDAGNEYQNKTASVSFLLEAVQGNAEIFDKWDGTPDTTWYNTTDTTFTLSTAEQLAGLSALSASGNTFAGKTIVLDSSMDFDGKAWTPIKQFSGTFDGGEHTVSNFTLDGTSGRAGFIQNLGQYPATVKNLTLSKVNGVAASKQYFGILAANGHTSVLENVHVIDCKIETAHKEAWVGGIYGYFNWTNASNCTVENLEIDASNGAMFLGGFSGNMDQDLEINNVDIIGLKITLDATNGACQVGGFTGQTQTGHRQPTFKNCDVTSLDIVAKGEVQLGGFVGDAGAHTIANNCTVEGKIDASGVTDNRSFIGGFIADSGWNNNESSKGGHKLTNCSADVDIITGGSTAGGFIGSTTAYHSDGGNRNMPITMTNCTATGTVTVADGASATIGGFAGEAERGTFKNCTTTSDTFIGKIWDGYTLNNDGNGTLTVTK